MKVLHLNSSSLFDSSSVFIWDVINTLKWNANGWKWMLSLRNGKFI